MPELPEVETILRDVQRYIAGAEVAGAEVLDERIAGHPGSEVFLKRLTGRSITEAWRRGKHLVLGLDSGDSLVLQLKIGGQLLLVPPVEMPTTDLMLRLDLEDGRKVVLRDETSYTRAQVFTAQELEERFANLGPEPFDKAFTVDYLPESIGKRRAQIKPLLLDQRTVAGVGNIYVDEALFEAGINPRRKASSLLRAEWERLHRAIVSNLEAGIEHRGTTFSLYRDLLGRKGTHQDHLKVFLRTGKECPGCGGVVVKMTVGGRATFVCETCQPEEGEKDTGSEGAEQLELL
ncbi:bifunctional DNA-formamidopyrimidine glycosylase/DNA-(apurinic or apyrimidinic site) lyase [Rubrobacter indicoceani]|uniref:bifunctional DNA-formamidopyrimidine glycosylase/DNA-(apurinic or apyrimidinic site) lyase n=1 Tax=Rubrobacter indicoceani TaxID=2051957 RepID=UPI0013C455D5|nr:bifunctional DNA-formamidopyrimidine glycosylase/DNA-(apurinic or apyrimidinic site) lyase [Rubrobacter indicoceani]